jgi:hypothetical protein
MLIFNKKMGISYYKCVYCNFTYSEAGFEKEFYVPDEYECDYDVCNECVDELFEVGTSNIFGGEWEQTYYVKEYNCDYNEKFNDFQSLSEFIDRNHDKKLGIYVHNAGDDLPSPIVYDYDDDITRGLRVFVPKKTIWKKRELERIDSEINSLEKKRKTLQSFPFD